MTQDNSNLQPNGQPAQSPLVQMLQLKAVWVSAIGYGVGAYLHYRGRNLTTNQNADLYQFIGLLFDAVSSTLIYAANQHRKSKANATAIVTAVNKNAEVLDKATPAHDTVARVPVDDKGVPAPLNPPTNVPVFSRVEPPSPSSQPGVSNATGPTDQPH